MSSKAPRGKIKKTKREANEVIVIDDTPPPRWVNARAKASARISGRPIVIDDSPTKHLVGK